eukprot:8700376-Ditylum_brightwellii.AAC.1
MREFMGVLYAITQSPRKGRVVGAFKETSDGLFPSPNLGHFGLKHWHFKELFSNWPYATIPQNVREQELDVYWATGQFIEQFNLHYKINFEHGWLVTIDEQISWGWARDQPG